MSFADRLRAVALGLRRAPPPLGRRTRSTTRLPRRSRRSIFAAAPGAGAAATSASTAAPTAITAFRRRHPARQPVTLGTWRDLRAPPGRTETLGVVHSAARIVAVPERVAGSVNVATPAAFVRAVTDLAAGERDPDEAFGDRPSSVRARTRIVVELAGAHASAPRAVVSGTARRLGLGRPVAPTAARRPPAGRGGGVRRRRQRHRPGVGRAYDRHRTGRRGVLAVRRRGVGVRPGVGMRQRAREGPRLAWSRACRSPLVSPEAVGRLAALVVGDGHVRAP